jgi:hypothetical protein
LPCAEDLGANMPYYSVYYLISFSQLVNLLLHLVPLLNFSL